MSMQFLIDFAQQDLAFREVSQPAGEFPLVQSIFLDLDSYWLYGWIPGRPYVSLTGAGW